MKLTQDQTELLMEIEPDQMRAVMAVIGSIVEDVERDVLTLNLTKDTESELVYRKAKSEGARKVYTSAMLAFKLKK